MDTHGDHRALFFALQEAITITHCNAFLHLAMVVYICCGFCLIVKWNSDPSWPNTINPLQPFAYPKITECTFTQLVPNMFTTAAVTNPVLKPDNHERFLVPLKMQSLDWPHNPK